MNTTKFDKLIQLANKLDGAVRCGGDVDQPEGSRYIQISDSLAKDIAEMVREAGLCLNRVDRCVKAEKLGNCLCGTFESCEHCDSYSPLNKFHHKLLSILNS